jgi:uncharacterized damage-inducible protein DinB
MEWADARVWAAVPPGEPADARLRHLLTHIHLVQYAFVTVWQRKDVNAVYAEAKGMATLGELRAWARSYYAEAHTVVETTPEAHLNEAVEMPWASQVTAILGRPPGPTTMGETVFQVTSHTTYHRGQVNVRLRELGVTPPLVDYIAWLWNNRPAPEWNA